MPLRIAVCLSLTAALLALPAAVEAADVVRPSSVSSTALVPAGATRTVSLQCPSSSVALSGAVTRTGPGVTIRRSTPGSEPGTWRFRVAVQRGAGARRAQAVLRCVRLAVPNGLSGVRLAVKTRSRRGAPVPVGGTASVAVRCGPAWLATGYGLDAGSGGNVRLASAMPVASGWRFTLENVGSAPASAGVSVRCVRQTVRASRAGGSAELRFQITRPSQANGLGTSPRPSFSHSCGGRLFSLATGFTVDPLATIELAASGPLHATRGRWQFRQASGGDEVRTFLVCLSRSSRFK
jgi:hypothetical protein